MGVLFVQDLNFVFHVLIISSNACTGEVKFKAVIRDFFAKKQSHTYFLNRKCFSS